MKFLLKISIVGILVWLASFYIFSQIYQVDIQTLQDYTVMIQSYDGEVKQGSGVFIGPNLVITCKHVIRGRKNIQLIVNGTQIKGEVVKDDGKLDLALLKVEGDYPYSQLRLDPEIGEKIYVVGAPVGYEDTVTRGYIANITEDYLLLDARISGGCSGGGVFDTQGNLLGIVQMAKVLKIFLQAEWTNFAIPARKIEEFLKEERNEARFD